MTIYGLYRTLWRHKILMVLMTTVVVATAYVLTSRETKLYTATALVRVQQNVPDAQDVFSALMTGERLARTYVSIAQTESVRNLVKERLHGKVPDSAIAVQASQVSDLELLDISVTNSDPKVAATVANAVPGALASFIAETGTVHDTITTVDRAEPPTVPTSPNLKLNLVIAFMLGLILSAGLALLKETFADRIDGAEDLERLTGRPVIATIPHVKFAPLGTVFPQEEPLQQVTEISLRPTARPKRVVRWSARG
jgi:capsular polysaccharide biosynthesis protein